MLDAPTLQNFRNEVNKTWSIFCVWMYLYNNYVNNQKKLNQEKYRDFTDILNGKIIPSLQHVVILGVARLTDSPYFQSNKNKPRLSIYYIQDLIDNNEIKELIEKTFGRYEKIEKVWQINSGKYPEFLNSVKKVRDNFLAHRDVKYELTDEKIKKGIESFFIDLENIIQTIQNKLQNLKSVDKPALQYTEEKCQKGVQEIFDKLIANI